MIKNNSSYEQKQFRSNEQKNIVQMVRFGFKTFSGSIGALQLEQARGLLL